MRASSATCGRISSAPREQFTPTTRGFACSIDVQNASAVWPESVRPLRSTMAMEIHSGSSGPELPLWISIAIVDLSGPTLSGQTAEAFWTSIEHAKPLVVGVNCSLGAEEMRPHVAELARIADVYVASHPNAGLPNAFGGYDETPDETAELLKEFAAAGLVNIVGGCCGTTPAHIRQIASAVREIAPRQVPGPRTHTR